MSIDSIIIYDKQYITQIGFIAIISEMFDYNIQSVYSKQELVKELSENKRALVLLDFGLSDLAGTDELLNIMARFQSSSWILISDDFVPVFVRRMSQFTANIVSFLLKSSVKDDIAQCFHQTTAGHRFISPLLKDMIAETNQEAKEALTLTESEVLKEIALGMSAKQVAIKRHSSVHTIITHKKNIYRKLQINTIQEAYVYAMRSGILTISDYSI